MDFTIVQHSVVIEASLEPFGLNVILVHPIHHDSVVGRSHVRLVFRTHLLAFSIPPESAQKRGHELLSYCSFLLPVAVGFRRVMLAVDEGLEGLSIDICRFARGTRSRNGVP